MLELGLTLVFIGLIRVLYINTPNIKIFISICIFIFTVAGTIGYFVNHPRNTSEETAMIAKEKTLAQQYIFGEWYADYQRKLDALDYNWQQYNMILTALRNDDISQETAYSRLSQLETDAASLRDNVARMNTPATLNDENYKLTNDVHKKTIEYAEAQLRTIHRSVVAANPYQTIESADTSSEIKDNISEKDNSSNPNPAEDNQLSTNNDLIHRLNKIMVTEAPVALFTAQEISAIRDNLYLPEDNLNGTIPDEELPARGENQ